MKRGTFGHPKLLDLAVRLGLPRAEAYGLLNALLDWTYEYAIRGDIGRWPDAVIAAGAGWEHPGSFVEHLVDAKWVDRHRVHRLVVHDLHAHADRTWQQRMERLHLTFANLDEGLLAESSMSPQLVLGDATLIPPARPVLSRPVQASSGRARPVRCSAPDGTLDDVYRQIASEAGLGNGDAEAGWVEFQDYWQGRRVKKSEAAWRATWRNRCLELIRRFGRNGRLGLPDHQSPAARRHAERLASLKKLTEEDPR